MARSSGGTRGDLFITVGGDVTPLRSAMKAGQSVLNEFGLAAIDVQKEVSAAFSNLASNAPAEAKRLEQSYSKTFAEIRRNAQAVLNAPSGQAQVQILNVAGAKQAAEAAEAEAAALRNVANAAIAADKAASGTNAGVRLLAISSEAAAQESEQHAAAMRDQVRSLELVQGHMATTAGAQTKLAATSGSARIGMIQLGQQMNDLAVGLSTGQRVGTVFAQQISQITFAMQLMAQGGENANSKFSKFAGFLGGPWGIALTVALTVLAPLVSKLIEGADASKKHQDAAELLGAALRGEQVSTDALVASLAKLNEQELKALDNDTKLIDQRYNLAKATLAAAVANKALLETQLAQAKADRDSAVRAQQGAASGGKGAIEAASGDVARTQGDVDRLQSAVNAQTVILAGATQLLDEEMVRFARNAATAVGKVNIEFDRRQAATEKPYLGTFNPATKTIVGGSLNNPNLSDNDRKRLLAELTKKEHDLNVERQKAIETAQKLDRAEQGRNQTNADRQSGRQIDFTTATQIARSAGLQVNSGYRSPAAQAALFNNPAVNRPGNPVAPPGASAHNGANGKWAIDIQITDGVTPAKLRKIYADQGVSLTKVLKEKGHFHIEGSRSEAAAAEKAQDKAADLAQSQNDNFAIQSQRLDEQLLSLRSQMIGSVDGQARFAAQQVEADSKAYELSVQKAVNDGRLRDAQGKELAAQNDKVTQQRLAVIEVQRFIQSQAEIQRSLEQEYGFKIEELQYQESIARSSKDRRDLALEIVDAEYELKKRILEAQLAAALMAQKWGEAADIAGAIAQLPGQRARAQDGARRDNMSPMEQYIDSLPHKLGEVQDRLEDIETTALKELNKEAAQAITNFLGLKGAVGDVVDKLLELAFDTALSAILPKVPGRAAGGPVSSGSLYVVGEKGPEFFVPNSSGTIIPNSMISASSPKAASMVAANTNSPIRDVNVHQRFEFQGVALTQEEFMQGLLATRMSTIQAIREERRRA